MITEMILTFYVKGWTVERIVQMLPEWVKTSVGEEAAKKMVVDCINDYENGDIQFEQVKK